MFRTENSKIRRLMAGTMSLWLSALVVLCCCGSMAAGAEDPDSCPLAKYSEHCDKQQAVDPTISSVQKHESDCMSCCSIMREVYQQTRMTEQKVNFDAKPVEIIDIPVFVEVPLLAFEPETYYRDEIIPHPKIHILNRVLLI